jgi:hypothetical protein
MVKTGVLLLLLTCGLASGCGDGDGTEADDAGTGGSGGSGGNPPEAIEIEGTWVSEYGAETIDEEAWSGASSATIIDYSNAENYAVWRNPDDAMYFPGKFGRNVWTEVDDNSFYYCTVAYMSDSAEATADDAEPFDDSDPDTGGCGAMDSPWTKLSRIEIEGAWTSDFGTETIDSISWDGGSGASIVEFSNEENYAVWQNPDDAEFSPGKFGRNVWTEVDGDAFYYCTVAFMSDSAEATEDDAQPFDDSEPEAGGCGDMGFPWTKLTRE